MASALRAGTAWYGMRPPSTDEVDQKSTEKSDKGQQRPADDRAQRQRRYQTGTARIAG